MKLYVLVLTLLPVFLEATETTIDNSDGERVKHKMMIPKIVEKLRNNATSQEELIQDLLKRVEVLENKVDDVGTSQSDQLTQLQTRIGNHDTNIGDQDTRIGDLDAELKLLKTQIGEQDTKIESQDTKFGGHIEDLNTKIGNLDKTVGEHGTKIGNQDTKIAGHIDDLNTKIGNVDTKVGNQDTTIENQDKRIGDLDTKFGGHVEDLNTKIANLDTKTGTQDTQVADQVTKIAEQAKALDTKMGNLDSVVGNQEAELNALKTRISEQVTQNNYQDTEIEKLNKRVDDQDTKLDSQNAKIAGQAEEQKTKLEEQAESLQREIGSLNTKTTELSTEVGNQNQKNGEQDAELTSLKTRLGEQVTENEKQSTEIEELNKRVGEQDTKIDDQSQQLRTGLESQDTKIVEQVKQLQTQIGNQDTKIAGQSEEIMKELEEQVQQLNTIINSQNTKITGHVNDLNSKIGSQDTKIAEQAENLNSRLGNQDKKIEEQSAALSNRIGSQAVEIEEITQCCTKVADQESKFNNMVTQIESHTEKIKGQEEQIKGYTTSIEDLNEQMESQTQLAKHQCLTTESLSDGTYQIGSLHDIMPGGSGKLLMIGVDQSSGADTAYRGVDGNKNSYYPANSCTHSTSSYGPHWFLVELKYYSIVGHVTVTNRGDCCGNRLNNFEIQAFDHDPRKHLNPNKRICKKFTGTVRQGATETIFCDQPLAARYLRLYKYSSTPLTICEFDAYVLGNLKFTDAFASSWSGNAKRAIDGSRNSYYTQGSCTHSNYVGGPHWWVGELEFYSTVKEVLVTNRGDCCADRLKDFEIQGFDANPSDYPNQTPKRCKTYSGYPGYGQTVTITCEKPINARFLRLYKPGNALLTICEFEARGQTYLLDGATQSLSLASAAGETAAWRALDHDSSTCSMTRIDGLNDMWWQLDFKEQRTVRSVTITNRNDAQSSYLKEFVIYVYKEHPSQCTGPNEEFKCSGKTDEVGAGKIETFTCQKPLTGRYLRIVKKRNHAEALSLCEVVVNYG